jgi:hypothetical protein
MNPSDPNQPPLTDAEAVAELWQLVDRPDSPDLDKATRDKRDEIIRSLPLNPQAPGITPPSAMTAAGSPTAPVLTSTGEAGAGGANRNYDLLRINNFASDLFGKVATDQAATQAGWSDPATGKYYSSAPVEEPSYLTTKFRNLGLPTPIERYDDPARMQELLSQVAPNYPQDLANQQTQVSDLQAAQDAALSRARRLDASDTDVQQALTEMTRRNTANQAQLQRAQGLGDLGSVLAEQSDIGRTPPQQRRGGPTINLGGRITGTGTDTYGRTRTNPNATGEGSKVAGPGLAPLQQVPTWAYGSPDTGFQTAGSQGEAMARALYGGFFGIGDKKSQATKLTPQVASQSKKARTAADRAFEQANTNRFRATQATTPDRDTAMQAAGQAYAMANLLNRTPFLDAMLQRQLGGRAQGLRI